MDNLVAWRRRTRKGAGKDLPARLSEVLREEGIEDWVDARVPVRQTVSDDAKGKGRVIKREGAKLHPHGDDVVRQPAEGEGSDQQKNGLSCLQSKNTRKLKKNPPEEPSNSNRTSHISTHAEGFNKILRHFHKKNKINKLKIICCFFQKLQEKTS